MRRKDREVLVNNTISDIINSCNVIRLGFNDNGKVYIVPMNFGYSEELSGSTITRKFYFHSAKEGRKIDLMKSNPNVGFELDCGYELKTGKTAYDYTALFKSIIGEGKIKIITQKDEKLQALKLLMKHYSTKMDWDYPDAVLDEVFTFCLEVETLSCKWHK